MELNCEYGDLSNNIQNCKQQITIEIRNLSCNANKKETTDHSNFILKNVYAKFRPGHLGAIIGPSGAGKSTLLNILSGYRIHGTTGSILVNGQKRNLSQFRKMSCYITQDVALLPLLTTEETLLFAAEQKLGQFINKSKKIEMVIMT
ncbi:ATP-binding cassette sub-family G member 1 [Blattella germanica]|nr:ATP-binding cassette sub-family G member 1 [Blattella germanica]